MNRLVKVLPILLAALMLLIAVLYLYKTTREDDGGVLSRLGDMIEYARSGTGEDEKDDPSQSAPDDSIQDLKKLLKEKYDVSEPMSFVSGDKTGKWRIVKVYNSIAPSQYAVDYAKAYMEDADISEIHYIVNFGLKTTTKLQIVLGRLHLTTTEYVDKEEHDATIIGEGLLLSREYFDLNTGLKLSVEAEPSHEGDYETVDNDTFLMEVMQALDGAIAPDEKLNEISFDGSELTISVEILGDTSIRAKKAVANASIPALTYPILDMDVKYYNTWDVIILDFGEVGEIILDKSMVVDDGLGKYFKTP